ncbi:ABC transporter permease [Anaerophilus nitritogenes]|uniref:ABC transporter permease n=1 Tax=Anaerophilus nitritogenes TaxID=2498136 RepID=UPI0013E9D9AE|nr:ABC transporter permease [Anaerophilus nitritogenes]
MLKWMRLEFKKHKINTYVHASVIIAIVLFILVFLFAYIPTIDNDSEMQIFRDYHNLLMVCGVLSLVSFSILSSVMYCKFIIQEYGSNRIYMLFSYPVHRGKILFSKVLSVFLFIIVAVFMCNTTVFTVFAFTESFFSLMEDAFTVELILKTIQVSIVMAVIAATIGVIAMGLGYIKKSVPTTIVSAMLLSSLFSNIASINISNAASMNMFLIIFMGVTIAAGSITTIMLIKKVDRMEAQ